MQERAGQLQSVGWLCSYLGAPREGLELVQLGGGYGRSVLTRSAAAAIDGLLTGERGPALALDRRLIDRNSCSRPGC